MGVYIIFHRNIFTQYGDFSLCWFTNSAHTCSRFKKTSIKCSSGHVECNYENTSRKILPTFSQLVGASMCYFSNSINYLIQFIDIQPDFSAVVFRITRCSVNNGQGSNLTTAWIVENVFRVSINIYEIMFFFQRREFHFRLSENFLRKSHFEIEFFRSLASNLVLLSNFFLRIRNCQKMIKLWYKLTEGKCALQHLHQPRISEQIEKL